MTGLWFGARRREIAELEQRLRDTEARLAGVVRSQRCAGLDDLTGLPGYRVFHTVLRREWDRARRDHVALSFSNSRSTTWQPTTPNTARWPETPC